MTVAWRWKAGAALLFTLLAVWFVLPNFVQIPLDRTGKPIEDLPWYYKMLPASEVRLGLDLQGGIHMVLGIDLSRALTNESDRYVRDFQEILPESSTRAAFTSVPPRSIPI